jgi:hypothetical protein
MVNVSAENSASIFIMFLPAADIVLKTTVPQSEESPLRKREIWQLAEPATMPNYRNISTVSWVSHGNETNWMYLLSPNKKSRKLTQ